MKKTLLTFSVIIISALVICSCHKDHDKYDFAETSSARSFIQQYDSIDEIEFRQLETRRISVNIKHSKMGGLWNTRIYDSLCKKHNDLSFYGKINVGKTSHVGYTAIGTDFQKIEISCNKDYNSEHPAGTLLNDIVRLISGTPYPYIKSGYKKTFNKNDPLSALYEVYGRVYLGSYYLMMYLDFKNSDLIPVFPVDKKVSELTKEDLTLVSPYFGEFYVEKLPEAKGDYEFTIKLYGDDGKVYSGKAIMKF